MILKPAPQARSTSRILVNTCSLIGGLSLLFDIWVGLDLGFDSLLLGGLFLLLDNLGGLLLRFRFSWCLFLSSLGSSWLFLLWSSSSWGIIGSSLLSSSSLVC